MEALIFALVPFIVTPLTSLIKRIPLIDALPEGPYKWVLRFIVALLSFGGVIVAYMTTGTVDTNGVSTFVLALLTFLSSTGIHFLGKKK